ARRYRAQLANHLAERGPELDRAAWRVGLPERDLAGLARRGGDDHLRRSDVNDPPRRRAQDERFADARLVHHLLVQLSHAAAVLRKVHRVEASVRDGARVGHGETLRARAAANLAGHAIPNKAWSQLHELVGRVSPAEHVEHRLECARPEVAVWI